MISAIFKSKFRAHLAFAASALLAFSSAAADMKPAIDPQADALLQRMGDFLGKQQFFSASAEIWQDVQLASGQQIQSGRMVELQVRRPDKFHSKMRSAHRSKELFYDGKSLTLLNRINNFYGSAAAPATLDETLDFANDSFGIVLPLEDLIVSDPYRNAIDKAVSGISLGAVEVLGVTCEHLAFSMDKIDWQIWIEQGARPAPRKIVITYKDEVGAPEYTAIFTSWDFQTELPDSIFSFAPPIGAMEISVAEIKTRKHGLPGGERQP